MPHACSIKLSSKRYRYGSGSNFRPIMFQCHYLVNQKRRSQENQNPNLYRCSPALHKSLGIFVPLIVVNCIILGRAEAFAGKNSVFYSFVDGLGMGIGFTLALILISIVRELLGDGKLWAIPIFGPNFEPVLLLILPPGAFLTLGLFLGFFNWIETKRSA